jgi:hypothetical protein
MCLPDGEEISERSLDAPPGGGDYFLRKRSAEKRMETDESTTSTAAVGDARDGVTLEVRGRS